jgi:tRNA pseudouridine55 synthase
MHGVFNLLKPPGMTSHDAVSVARRALGTKRIGHTGTLDPAAAGVLPLCVGQATRLVEYLQDGTKEYIAEATFGFETDTGDAVGQVLARGDASQVNLEKLRAALDGFHGRITQTPPIYSAVKKDGKKLYDLARAGQGEDEVEIPTREVDISSLSIQRFLADGKTVRAMLHVECSSGTYIRSLVRDIGRVLGSYATMTFLVRTRTGGFTAKEAYTLEELETAKESVLLPMPEVLGWCAPHYIVDDAAMALFVQGKRARFEMPGSGLTSDFDSSNTRRLRARQCGVTTETQRVAVINTTHTTAALVVPSREDKTVYQSEKVFPLDIA